MRKLIAILLLFVSPLSLRAQESPEAVEQMQKLIRFYRYLNALYVEPIEMEPLVEEAIRAMLAKLDPHSTYLDRDALAVEKVTMDGEFSGIGIEFRVVSDTIRVHHLLTGGAAERAGLLAGDRIVRIDTLSAVGIKQHEVPALLRGRQGSKVDLKVWRPAFGEMLDFTLVRDKVSLHTVSAAYRLSPECGYIKLDRFGRTTDDEMAAAFDAIGRVRTLILDLQGNGGGLLKQAVWVAEQFLPAGSLIVTTEGQAVADRRESSSKKGHYRKGRLILLVDENSASASEIVAGAVQDWDRGWIVGRPTFGKGLVQRQIDLRDSTAVRITIARYHTPSGRVIQRPYQMGEREAYYQAQRERRLTGDLLSSADSLPRYRTLRLGREVTGGGGIMPDVVVRADTSGYSPYYGELIRRNLLNDFLVGYVDTLRTELMGRYPAYADFRLSDEELQGLRSSLRSYAACQGLAENEAEEERSREWIDRQLRIGLAVALYGSEVRIRALNDAGGNALLNETQRLLNEGALTEEIVPFRNW